jgi:hypothetical protein
MRRPRKRFRSSTAGISSITLDDERMSISAMITTCNVAISEWLAFGVESAIRKRKTYSGSRIR